MKRTQFVVVGKHPLFPPTIKHLIEQGYALVPGLDQVDPLLPCFLVVGAEVYTLESSFALLNELRAVSTYPYPVLVLSSSSVYSDRDHWLKSRPVLPMDEALGHVITSSLDPSSVRPLTALLVEHAFVQRTVGKTVVVRPFNVYGPDCYHGVVNRFLTACSSGEPLLVHSPGRQVRTFLWQEDFEVAVGAAVRKLLNGARGIYNIGSEEQVEILSLAKSIGHALGVEAQIEMVEDTERHAWWKVPDIDRLGVLGWRPSLSLRSGLFLLARKQ